MKGARDILTGGASVIHARITRVQGSSPREEGAEMLVTASAVAGTIGGGQAEWQALHRAREMLAAGEMRDTLHIALGPEIGQCCGGRVTVELARLGEGQRSTHLDRLDSAALPHLLILGAGHVGRALARVALTLPWRVILVDTRAAELERLLGEFGLTRLRASPAMALSGGERRRCEIARALAAKPSIMLLDEPFAGIDPLSIADIRDLVKDLKGRGIGVLITDHNVRETLDIVDRACIIYGGQVLFAGSPQELVADENVRRLYLGEGFTL
ncbi:MAG: XdhC family protein [Roseinatronobacter sp.]